MPALLPDSADTSQETWQEGFLRIYSQLEQYASIAFQHLTAEAREDAITEVIANCLVAYQRLHERAELQRARPGALLGFAVLQYWDGRRVGTSQNSRDVMSPLARRKDQYEICSLGTPGEQIGGWLECLIDDTQTPVPDQVSFRIDYPRWLQLQTPRDRQIAQKLSQGYTTQQVAREYRLSPARVSQLRRELAESWEDFHQPHPEPEERVA